ncbi:ribonuclease H-like domain-containing protein [Tanacetum coccineum]
MTGSAILPTPLSEKLSLVTHHHLLTRVLVKLDLDNWNFGQWEFFFEELCATYEVDKYLRSSSTDNSSNSSAPLNSEELKVDKIVLSWLLLTLSDSLCARLVVMRPKTDREAWSLISDIVKDNKRSRTNALKAELRSIKLGDQKDVVHYAIDGLPETYNPVCGYMHWKDTFPDLKTVRSLLIAEEMRLKSKAPTLPMDYSSPMVIVAESGNIRRPTSTPQGKSWKPCFNFAKGSCSFGDSCHYVHDANARVSSSNSGLNKGRETNENTTHDLLNKLLNQLGNLGLNPTVAHMATHTTPPVAYATSPSPIPSPLVGPSPLYPPGFAPQAHGNSFYYPTGLPSTLAQQMPIAPSAQQPLCPLAPSPIPHAFLVSQHTWHQRLGHPGSDVLRRLVSNNVISCNKKKLPVICHACQLGKHVRLPFVSSNTIISSCFDNIHSDVWTSPIPSLSGFQYYILFLDHYSQFVWVYPLVRKFDVLSKFILFHNYVRTQFKCETRAFQCDHGGDFDNRNLHDLFNSHGIQFRFSCPKTSQQNGKSERMGVDVDETFSPIVKPGTIRTVLSLAASRHWPIHHLDVKNAFLHEDLSETVYMHQPPGFRDSTHPDYVCLLQRSLYGLKQAPRAWFKYSEIVILYYQNDIVLTQPLLRFGLHRIRYCCLSLRSMCIEILDTGCSLSVFTLLYPIFTYSEFRQLVLLLRTSRLWWLNQMPDCADCLTTRTTTSGYCVFLATIYSPVAKERQRRVLGPVPRQSAVYLSSNTVQHQRTKHIEIDIYFVRDLVATGQVRVLHVPSRYQFADIFTKGLPTALFEEFRSSLSVRCPPAQTAGEC